MASGVPNKETEIEMEGEGQQRVEREEEQQQQEDNMKLLESKQLLKEETQRLLLEHEEDKQQQEEKLRQLAEQRRQKLWDEEQEKEKLRQRQRKQDEEKQKQREYSPIHQTRKLPGTVDLFPPGASKSSVQRMEFTPSTYDPFEPSLGTSFGAPRGHSGAPRGRGTSMSSSVTSSDSSPEVISKITESPANSMIIKSLEKMDVNHKAIIASLGNMAYNVIELSEQSSLLVQQLQETCEKLVVKFELLQQIFETQLNRRGEGEGVG